MYFFASSNIKPQFILLLFAIHVVTACGHNWVAYIAYPNHGDIWFFFTDSIAMKEQLLKTPRTFFLNFFSASNFEFGNNSQHRFEFQYEFMKLINVLLNFFSFNNFYINTLLFSFISFYGAMALFKTFNSIYSSYFLPAFCALLIPSTLFWTACIHKDGLLYLGIGFFYYYFYQWLNNNYPLKKLLFAFLFLAIIFLARPNILITLLPAVFFWMGAEKKQLRRFIVIGCGLLAGVCILLVLLQPEIYTSFLKNISDRQTAFSVLKGNSKIYFPALLPTTASFIAALPRAFINGFFEPLPGVGGKLFYLSFSFELLMVWVIIVYALYLLYKKKKLLFSTFDYCCIIFCLPGLLIIGYTIPFVGAIVRYRSIFLPFLLAPFINILVSYKVLLFKKVDDWLKGNVMLDKRFI